MKVSIVRQQCVVEGCENKYYHKGYCYKHYNQVRTNRKIGRNRLDPNEFIIEEDVCKIKMFDTLGEFTNYAIVDKEDYNKVKEYKWHVNAVGYVGSNRRNSNKSIKLHRLIMDVFDDRLVDHKNHNKLNCRKRNLRICTINQNNQNSVIPKNNKSGAKGVSWNKQRSQWKVYIGINTEVKHLGYFNSIIEAAIAYNNAAIKYHGEFAYLNDIKLIERP